MDTLQACAVTRLQMKWCMGLAIIQCEHGTTKLIIPIQTMMNAVQIMEAVHRYVLTYQGRESVAAGLDTDFLVMAALVKV